MDEPRKCWRTSIIEMQRTFIVSNWEALWQVWRDLQWDDWTRVKRFDPVCISDNSYLYSYPYVTLLLLHRLLLFITPSPFSSFSTSFNHYVWFVILENFFIYIFFCSKCDRKCIFSIKHIFNLGISTLYIFVFD